MDVLSISDRLGKLKQGTIEKYLSSIDLDNKIDLYDIMIYRFLNRDLDDYFVSDVFNDLSEEDINKYNDIIHKYTSLCFFRKDPGSWTDSVIEGTLSDLDFVCMRIFDNIDFLYHILKNGEEECLSQLVKIQSQNINIEGSVIDFLRNVFIDDNSLIHILKEMSTKDGIYNDLTDKQKYILLNHPDGILYQIKDGDVVFSSNQYLKYKIIDKLFELEDASFYPTLSSLLTVLDDQSFEDVLLDIYLDYTNEEENYTIKKK